MTGCLVYVLSVLTFILVIEYGSVSAIQHDAQSGQMVLEVLIVVDNSVYQKWYNRTDPSSNKDRDLQTKEDLTEYLGAIMHSTNTIFESLDQYDISIRLKLVGIEFKSSVSSSSFTETTKFTNENGTVGVNEELVFDKFQPIHQQLQATIPHDHAMVFTAYQVLNSTGAEYAGVAKLGAACLVKSMSVVTDDGFDSGFVIAHEIGHSLGSEHDGKGNVCEQDAGFVMDPQEGHSHTNQWIFSHCSAGYIKDYVAKLKRENHDCLRTLQDDHVDPLIDKDVTKWYGQIYTLDEQCKIALGPESYFGRALYNETRPFACHNGDCKLPGEKKYRRMDAGDGTPCGKDKWCMKSECVPSEIQIDVPDVCFAGEHVGLIADIATCDEIGTQRRGMCDQTTVQRECCVACAGFGDTNTSSTDGDGQCRAKLGPNSYMCRNGGLYSKQSYQEVVCEQFECADPTDPDNYCVIITASEQTACGYKKSPLFFFEHVPGYYYVTTRRTLLRLHTPIHHIERQCCMQRP